MRNVQSGFDLDGDATTIPADAPEAPEPLGPMLLRTPLRATVFSDSMNPLRVDCRRERGTAEDTAAGTSSAKVKILEPSMMD